MHQVITIDGPAASGKSTVARGVALALGYLFVSSGHFYRALTWGAIRAKIEHAEIAEWLKKTMIIVQLKPALHLILNGIDTTPYLFKDSITARVSQLAVIQDVRDFVTTHLRALSKTHNLVVEGRDIGTVIFPESPLKFYLDASPIERARRRKNEGHLDLIYERDQLDSERTIAPLRIPPQAIVIDTTYISITQVIDRILAGI